MHSFLYCTIKAQIELHTLRPFFVKVVPFLRGELHRKPHYLEFVFCCLVSPHKATSGRSGCWISTNKNWARSLHFKQRL